MHEKDLRIGFLCDFYGRLLTGKQYEAISMYYDDDLSLAEIAAHSGITRQGVRDCIKKGEAILQEMEEKLGLAARFEQLKADATQIQAAAEVIGRYHSRGSVNTEVMAQVSTIQKLCERIIDDGI